MKRFPKLDRVPQRRDLRKGALRAMSHRKDVHSSRPTLGINLMMLYNPVVIATHVVFLRPLMTQAFRDSRV